MSTPDDFDGDGKADLLWRNISTGDATMWIMNGASVTSQTIVSSIATTWSTPATLALGG